MRTAGILVKTGKYQAGDEGKITPPPTVVVADLAEAVQWLRSRTRSPSRRA